MQLSAHDKELLRRYFISRPITRAYLFGSYARKTAASKSDLDILVELDHSEPIGMRFFTFQLELEELLNKKVDVVSLEGLSKHVKPFVDKDKVLIYEREELTDSVRVSHILDAIAEVGSYLEGVLYEDFLRSSEKKFATIKQIEIVGEACNRLSKEFRDKHPEIKWKEINGFRNISIHEYFGVNFKIVWEIAQNDLPVLKKQFNSAIT